MTQRILIVESDDAQRESLELLLAGESYEVLSASSGEAALQRLETHAADVVLCELQISGLDGLDLLPQLRRRAPGAPILLMSSCGGQELAAETLRRGAYDYITKPFDLQEIRVALRQARDRGRLHSSNQLLQREIQRTGGERPIVAASPPMIELLELLERAAEFKTSALLTGESGTGKEGLARAIHAQSSRRNEPFVVASCTTQPDEKLDRQLFGHVQSGAFRNDDRAGLFVEANGGTIFLDEIGALPQSLQSKLLRVLQEEEIPATADGKAHKLDVRVIAASAKDLAADAQAGDFSEELLERLGPIHLNVPPLRERRQDIPLLVDHFMAKSSQVQGRPATRIAGNALERLTQYSWPGNVRELENVVERAIILAEDDRVTLRQLPANVVAARGGEADGERQGFSLKRARQFAEAEMIERALSATQGNRTHAAKLLQISHRALLYKIKDYQIRN